MSTFIGILVFGLAIAVVDYIMDIRPYDIKKSNAHKFKPTLA